MNQLPRNKIHCFPRVRESRSREGAKDVTRRYEHGIVFLHSDEDHVTVIHFRRNYLCLALRVATLRDATRLRRARTNRVSRYAKAVTDQNKIGSDAPFPLLLARAYIFTRNLHILHPLAFYDSRIYESIFIPSFSPAFSLRSLLLTFFFFAHRSSVSSSVVSLADDDKVRPLQSAVSSL